MNNSVSSWLFPPPAVNLTLQSTAVNTVDFNDSIIDFLRRSAQTPPSYGFGSTRSAYVQDTVKLAWGGNITNEGIDQWCLVCKESSTEHNGWSSCQNFSNTTTTQFIRVDIGSGKEESYRLPRLNREYGISAAICAFGVATEQYDLSLAYSLVNKVHLTGSVNHVFSSESPTGEEATPATSCGFWSTSTCMPTDHYRTYSPHRTRSLPQNPPVGVAIGVIIVVFGVIIIVSFAFFMKRSENKSAPYNAHREWPGIYTKERRIHEQNSSRPSSYSFVRDRLSEAERGESTRSPRLEAPPPAYEIMAGYRTQPRVKERPNK